MANGEDWAAEVRTALAAVDASPSSSCSASGDQIPAGADLRVGVPERRGTDERRRADRVLSGAGTSDPSGRADRTGLYPAGRNGDLQESEALSRQPFPAITLQRGNSFVVVHALRAHVHSAGAHAFYPDGDRRTDAKARFPARRTAAGGIADADDGRRSSGRRTTCTPPAAPSDSFNCVTAYTTIPEIVAANRGAVRRCASPCAGCFGACLGPPDCLSFTGAIKACEQQLRRAIRRDKLKVVYQPIVNLARRHALPEPRRWCGGRTKREMPWARTFSCGLAERQGFVSEITRLVLRPSCWRLGPMLRNRSRFSREHQCDLRRSWPIRAFSICWMHLWRWPDCPRKPLRSRLPKARRCGTEVAMRDDPRPSRARTQRSHRRLRDRVFEPFLSAGSFSGCDQDRPIVYAIHRHRSSVTMAILPQILAMAEALDLRVIVEGVETRRQAEYFAADEQPVLAQGWLFGQPVPAQEFCHTLAGIRAGPQGRTSHGGSGDGHRCLKWRALEEFLCAGREQARQ